MRISDWSSDVCSSDLSGPADDAVRSGIDRSADWSGNIDALMSAAVTVEGIGTHAIIAGQRNVIDRLARRNGNGGMGHIVHLLPGRKNGAEISIGRRSRLYAQRLIDRKSTRLNSSH